MDWIIIGKLFLTALMLHISLDLFKGMLRLRRKYGLSFGMEDWVEWKDWFIFYLPLHTARIRWYSIGWFGGFTGVCTIDWVLG